MFYEDYLKNLKKCPFCNFKKNQIIKENDFSIFTISKAPYSKDHLLIFPKRHALNFESLNENEKKAILELIDFGVKTIKRNYENFTLIYREGSNSGKSLDHLHCHIIPNKIIGVFDIDGKKRKIFSDLDYNKKIKDFISRFL